jgi:hypothetical protein
MPRTLFKSHCCFLFVFRRSAAEAESIMDTEHAHRDRYAGYFQLRLEICIVLFLFWLGRSFPSTRLLPFSILSRADVATPRPRLTISPIIVHAEIIDFPSSDPIPHRNLYPHRHQPIRSHSTCRPRIVRLSTARHITLILTPQLHLLTDRTPVKQEPREEGVDKDDDQDRIFKSLIPPIPPSPMQGAMRRDSKNSTPLMGSRPGQPQFIQDYEHWVRSSAKPQHDCFEYEFDDLSTNSIS